MAAKLSAEEIKALEKDTRAYIATLTMEKKALYEAGRAQQAYRRELNEIIKVVKSDKDVMTSLNKVQDSLANGVRAAGRELSVYKEKLNASTKLEKAYKKEIDKTEKSLKDLGKRNKNNAKEYDGLKIRLKALNETSKKTEKSNKTLSNSIVIIGEVYKKANASAKKFDKGMAELNDILETQVGSWDELKDAADQYIKKQEELIDNNRKLSASDKIVAKGKLKDKRYIESVRGKVSVEDTPAAQRDVDTGKRIHKAVDLLNRPKGKGKSSELYRQFLEEKSGQMKGSLGTLLSGKGGFFGSINAAKGLQQSTRDYMDLKKSILGAAKGSKLLGGNIKMLGLAFEGLSKANIFLMIAGMVGKLVAQLFDGVKALDTWMKEYNKTFMQIYGPTTMMKDVKGSMRDFTDAVFDMNRNLSMGLKSEDIMGLFKSLSSSGMSLGSVVGKFGSYDKAIRESVKLSRDFGVSIEEMGGMVGDQMMEMKSSLGEIKKSFENMSYDASIAGIQSQKFYQAVYTASSSLSSYGNYLDSASDKLKSYIKTGALGFQDATKLADSMMSAFKNMSVTQAGALISMTGGLSAYQKKLEENIKERQDVVNKTIPAELAALEKKRPGMKEEDYTKAKEALEERVRKINGEIEEASRLLADKSGMAIMGNMSYFGDQFEGFMGNMMKDWVSKGYDIFAEAGPAFDQAVSQSGLTPEVFRTLKKNFLTGMSAFEKVMDDSGNYFANLGPDIKDKLNASLEVLKKGGEWGTFAKEWEGPLKDMGFSMETFRYQMENNAENMIKFIKEGKGSFGKNRKELEMTMLGNMGSKNIRMKGKDIAADNERQSAIAEATTSLEDYIGIGQEGLKYDLKNNDLTAAATAAAIEGTKILSNISGNLSKYFRSKGVIKSEQEVKAFKESKQGYDVKNKLKASKYLQDSLAERPNQDDARSNEIKEQIIALDDEVKKTLESVGMAEKLPEMRAEAGGSLRTSKVKLAKEKGNLETLQENLAGDPENKSIQEAIKKSLELISKFTKEVLPVITQGAEGTFWNFGENNAKRDQAKNYDDRSEVGKSIDDFMDSLGLGMFNMGFSKIGQLTGGAQYNPYDEENRAKTEDIPKANDKRITEGGLLKGTEGDWLISAQGVAKGMLGSKGEFIPKFLDSMGGSGGEKNVTFHNNFNIDSLNGDPQDLANKIKPFMEQLIARDKYESQKRQPT